MKKEIIFTGKRIDNGEIVKGHYFTPPLTDENSGLPPETGWFFLAGGERRHCIEKDGVVYTVTPESVKLDLDLQELFAKKLKRICAILTKEVVIDDGIRGHHYGPIKSSLMSHFELDYTLLYTSFPFTKVETENGTTFEPTSEELAAFRAKWLLQCLEKISFITDDAISEMENYPPRCDVRKLKVYEMNDMDYYADYSLEEAKEHFEQMSGDPDSGEDARELTDEEFDRLSSEDKSGEDWKAYLATFTTHGYFAGRE